jgi:triosephosphate isomerase (TIM)
MTKLMAANWKMYKTREEAGRTAKEMIAAIGTPPEDREVLLFPPFTALAGVHSVLVGKRSFAMGGQNFYPEKEGAFTGEISPAMLKECGCTYGLVGHSERRHVLGETDDFLARKVPFGLEQGLYIVFCIGETIDERRAGRVEEVLTRQIEKGLGKVDKSLDAGRLAVAYEPVWAIGTGEVAQEKDIVQAHTLVRERLSSLFTQGETMRILYGGSVKPDNCAGIIALDNVDGVLVGGASLNAESFGKIVLAGNKPV